jgi:hypothetical protein
MHDDIAPAGSPDTAGGDGPDATAPGPDPARDRGRTLRRVAVGSLFAGGIAVAAIVGPLAAQAASPSPSATTAPAATGGPGGFGGFGRNETVSDASVVATAIGITEADLTTALSGGQTVAAVAKAHNVAVQTVIDALVKDGLDELAARVTAGTLTQAQADAMKAEVTQRATDQVNGTFGRH